MDRVLRGITNYCAAGKLFLEYSRYTLLNKSPSQNRREKCAAGISNNTTIIIIIEGVPGDQKAQKVVTKYVYT
eukprot:SAG25_NODE_1144_length_3810_cov_1.881164_1_plen_72_part_10